MTSLALTPDSTLYGVNWSTDNLYTIDPSTASPTLIGPTGGGNIRGGAQLTATGDGKLWLVPGGALESSDLYRVNRSTGQLTFVGPIGQGFVTGIAGTCSGHLFGYAAGNLLRIDPATGAGSVIGATGLSDSVVLALDDTEHLWAVQFTPAHIYRLDTTTGTATFVASTSSFVNTLALPHSCHH